MNKTPQEAADRVLQSRTGSLVDPSEEYLLALLRNIHKFKDDVEAELHKLNIKKDKDNK